jgi:hypothetical protein
MPFRLPTSAALLCLAITAFAIAVPVGALEVPVTLLTPVWLYQPPPPTDTIAPDLDGRHEQTISLAARRIPRGPPAHPLA